MFKGYNIGRKRGDGLDLVARLSLLLGISLGINLILGYAVWVTANYIGEAEEKAKEKND